MPSVRQIKRRIRSVENTGKLTKAMEMVAAAKMRRAQSDVVAARPYAAKMNELLSHLAAMPIDDPTALHPLLKNRETENISIIQITPDRGMCGGLVGNLNRKTGTFMLDADAPSSVVTVGVKGRDFMVRSSRNVRASFTGLGDRPKLIDTTAVSHIVMDDFSNGVCDAVYLAYTEFVNTAVQRPVVRRLLPVDTSTVSAREMTGYIYEPYQYELMERMLTQLFDGKVALVTGGASGIGADVAQDC